MKKIIILMLTIFMAFSFTACGSTNTTDSASTADTAETTQTEDAAAGTDAQAPAKESQADTGAVYNVGICQLVQHPALDAATQGFKDALSEKLGDQVVFDEQNAAGDSATCATIVNQFVSSNYNLIMANATPALQAAASATGTIPVLGTSVTDYATALDIDNWAGVTGRNVSGTADLAPLDKQAEMIKELFPDAKNIGILYCSAEPNSKYQSSTIQGYLTEMGYTCTEYTFADTNDVASVTQTACSGSDVIFIPTDNTAASCTEAINNVAEPAGVPIVTGEEGICKGCGVATLSISYYDLGYATGEMAYEVLANGADVSAMEIQYSPNITYKYMADRAEALGVTIPDNYTAIEAE
ncbi:putative ABC transport system substrate-binding protein [Kineothrix alysoides]|uniref:Putative ABC transport system substrate-binding protein n=1 Tax=Kineothrix alysoides TaxID=1469948 RepID=A0A4R1R151_9FIRM|nr:ABC transporter substrate-binding protein [Kineothrix alysoides]TCL59032.1 putative ABC transport system substrate-binding protein [Kineothrix alysoides]